MASAACRRCSSVSIRVSPAYEIIWRKLAAKQRERPASLDRWLRKDGRALLHHVRVVEGIPGRRCTQRGRMRLVMADEVAHQGLGDAKLDVAVDVWIRGIEHL